METVEVVIKISKKDYEYVKEIVQKEEYPLSKFYYNIANGTPLPERHGRLIDADELSDEIHRNADITTVYTCFSSIHRLVKEAFSVIEADKSESENDNGN